jgi:hypothetical protein
VYLGAGTSCGTIVPFPTRLLLAARTVSETRVVANSHMGVDARHDDKHCSSKDGWFLIGVQAVELASRS